MSFVCNSSVKLLHPVAYKTISSYFCSVQEKSDMGDIKKTESKAKDKGRKKVKISFRKLSEKEHSAYRVPSYPYLVP